MDDDELTHAATDYAVGGRGPACRKRCSSCVNMAFRRGAEWERDRARRRAESAAASARAEPAP